MKLIRSLIVASSLLLASQANALNINPGSLSVQGTFDALSADLAAAAWMNPSNSAEPHSAGFIPVGIQAALEVSGVSINPNDPHWALVGETNLPSILPIPKLRLSVGIPFGLDVSYMLTQIPNSNVKITGFEGRMAFGNYIPLPFLQANVRYYQSAMTGVPDMEITSKGFAVMFGASLPIVKPYVEFGQVTATSTPSGQLVTVANLKEYSKKDTTYALGAKVELALFVINLEQAKIGDKDITSLKLGLEF